MSLNLKNIKLKNVNKILLLITPLVILILLASIGTISILKIKKENNLDLRLEAHEKIDLPEFSFENIDGNGSNLTNYDLIGKNYSVLNVFASWCMTCLAEHDILLKLSKNKKVKLYGVAFQDINTNTKEYLKKYKNPYLKVGIDNRGELSKILAINSIPETFIVNSEGQIIYRHQGNLTQDIIDAFK